MSSHLRLGAKFVILVVGILSITLGTSATWFFSQQQRLLQEQLLERSHILGHFASKVSTEAILAYDFVALEDYVQDVTARKDIIFSVVVDTNNRPLTSYFDPGKPTVRELQREEEIESVMHLLSLVQYKPNVIIERFPIEDRGTPLGNVVVGISKTTLEQEITENFIRQIVVYSAIIVFLSIAIYLVFRYNVLYPIRALIQGSRRVADGEYTEPVPTRSNDELGELTRAFNAMMRDVRKDQELLNFQANFDDLTGLPNRVHAIDKLHVEISRAARERRKFAVIFIDLNNFKFVNDTMGHRSGDTLLLLLSQRFKSVLRESDILARLGGDEFLLMLPTTGEPAEIKDAAFRLLDSLDDPICIGEHEVFLHCSMGIAIYPDDGISAEDLMANADNAMYQAKRSNTEDFRFFAPEMNIAIKERMALEYDLHKAILEEQFELYFQPIISAVDQRSYGAEALLRWNHPDRGIISPATFIPLAEATGKIVTIGKWVIRSAVWELAKLRSEGVDPGYVTVNVSRIQLDGDFADFIAEILDEAGVPVECLRVEVTESTLMEGYGKQPEVLRALNKMGIKLLLDDFGTGFSSLNNLKHFPFHTLKIDKSFIDGVPDDEGDAALVRGIIAMSRSLGLEVVAEGVEYDHQFRFLAGSQVDYIQGYLFARPQPVEEYRRFLLDSSEAS